MGKYLAERRIALGYTQKDIADMVGVTEATVSRWESGTIANMRRDKINLLAKALQTSTNFVMNGYEDSERVLPANIIPMPSTYKVPLVGTIACGNPILAVEEADETVEVPDFIHADFALRCKGDSMINARIFDGDVVYIRKQPQVENGQIAAVLVDDEATLKKVTLYPDKLVLEPANPMYDPLVFRGEEMNQVEILGKAVGFTSMID